MSRTLNFVDHILARGRHLHDLGRLQTATRTLRKLAGFEGLSAGLAEEVHSELAQIRMTQHQYAKARRHLSILLRYNPSDATYHYQMARAHDLDKESNPASALQFYRRSLELDPDQPQCLCDFGLLAIAMVDDEEEGITALRRAVELAPDDPEILGKVVEGLSQADLDQEAAQLIRAAQFRNPHDERFRQLWLRYQFRRLYREQHDARDRFGLNDQERPMILSFAAGRATTESPSLHRKRTRPDHASAPPAPHFPRPARLPRKRHA